MNSDGKNKNKTEEKLVKFIKKYKYFLIMLIFGAVLLLIPSGSSGKEEDVKDEAIGYGGFSLSEQEERLEKVLESVEGAGDVEVTLSLNVSEERVIARDTEEDSEKGENEKLSDKTNAVIISEGSGTESAVTLKYVYPEYRGAVITARGAGSEEVKLGITRAVSAFTGLGADRITVLTMNGGEEK